MQFLLPFVTLVVVGISLSLSSVDGYARYQIKLPNGGNVTGRPALGHVDSVRGGGPRNAFGLAFASVGFRWTVALCQNDTDGDGQTNGQELGDPCCSWVETGNLAYIATVSDPSDPTSMVNPLIYKGIQCTKSEAAIEAANKQAKKNKSIKPTTPAPPVNQDDTENDNSTSSSGYGMVHVPTTSVGTTQTVPAMALTVTLAIVLMLL